MSEIVSVFLRRNSEPEQLLKLEASIVSSITRTTFGCTSIFVIFVILTIADLAMAHCAAKHLHIPLVGIDLPAHDSHRLALVETSSRLKPASFLRALTTDFAPWLIYLSPLFFLDSRALALQKRAQLFSHFDEISEDFDPAISPVRVLFPLIPLILDNFLTGYADGNKSEIKRVT